MKRFFLLFVSVFSFFNAIFAAGVPCFSYEVFNHINVPGHPPALANRALIHYPYIQICANHQVIGAGGGSVAIALGRFEMLPIFWALNIPAIAPLPMNLANINLMILRRQATGIIIAPALIANLNAAMLGGAITPALLTSLRAGGYLSSMSAILNMLTLGVFPMGTILGVPMPAHFIPDSIMVHITSPQRVSKNLKEFSHSSLATGGVNSTLKDRINAPYMILGIPVPDSATIVSSDHLQIN